MGNIIYTCADLWIETSFYAIYGNIGLICRTSDHAEGGGGLFVMPWGLKKGGISSGAYTYTLTRIANTWFLQPQSNTFHYKAVLLKYTL